MLAKVIAAALAGVMSASVMVVLAAWVGVLPAHAGRLGLTALAAAVPVALLFTVVAVNRRR